MKLLVSCAAGELCCWLADTMLGQLRATGGCGGGCGGGGSGSAAAAAASSHPATKAVSLADLVGSKFQLQHHKQKHQSFAEWKQKRKERQCLFPSSCSASASALEHSTSHMRATWAAAEPRGEMLQLLGRSADSQRRGADIAARPDLKNRVVYFNIQ